MSYSPDIAKRSHLMSVEDARAAMLAAVTVLPEENVQLEDALGRILAKPVVAMRDQPPFAVSAMDGYAFQSSGAPAQLRVIGESAAGRGFEGRCAAGTAVRISTGAAMPDGADTVAIQEDVQRSGDQVMVPITRKGKNVRPRAGDFCAGQMLLEAGRRLDPVAISLAAASGAGVLPVIRPPRIAILSSGDELAPPGTRPGPWQIFDSGTYGVAALANSWGAQARRLAVIGDDAAAISRAAEEGLNDSDLLVVIGGASVGDHDHARPALMKLGIELVVGKIAVRPGKPTWFGTGPNGKVLGLPGNPASALVCSWLFLHPLLQVMLGRDPAMAFQRAHLALDLPANGPREHYLRARLSLDETGVANVRAAEDQDSSLISVFAAANALIRLAPDAPAISKGALVNVLPLDGT